MLKKCFASVRPETLTNRMSAALLALRFIIGVAMILHGWGKIQSPFSWMPPEAPVPGILQGLAALAEFGGGIALLLGFLTCLASIGLIITMSVAVMFHMQKGDGFVQGYELAAVYLIISLALLLAGPGKFSLDAKIFGRKNS